MIRKTYHKYGAAQLIEQHLIEMTVDQTTLGRNDI